MIASLDVSFEEEGRNCSLALPATRNELSNLPGDTHVKKVRPPAEPALAEHDIAAVSPEHAKCVYDAVAHRSLTVGLGDLILSYRRKPCMARIAFVLISVAWVTKSYAIAVIKYRWMRHAKIVELPAIVSPH